MKKQFLFLVVLFSAINFAFAQRQKRVGLMKIDEDLEVNSTSCFLEISKLSFKSVPLWRMGDYSVTESKTQWMTVQGLDWTPRFTFITEGFTERDWNDRKHYYALSGPNDFKAQCNFILQAFSDNRNIELNKSTWTNTREYRINLMAELFNNSGVGWKIEATHAHGSKLKAKGFYEFLGKLYNQQDTITISIVQDRKKGSPPIIFGNDGGFYGFHFYYNDKCTGALQLAFNDYKRTLWLRNDLPEHIRNAIASSIPAFLQMTDWIDDTWIEN